MLNGFAGDAILGGNFIKYEWLQETDSRRMGLCIVALARYRGGRSAGGPVASAQRPGACWAAMGHVRCCKDGGDVPLSVPMIGCMKTGFFRNTNAGTMLLRSGVESHSPFFDNDFIDAVTAVRQEHKFKHRLYLEVMRRAAPRAASVTWQRTNIPPAWGYYANFAAMGMHRVIGKLARSPFGIDPFKSLKAADPAAWMRGPWRAAVQELVLGSDAQRHGLWNAQAAENLWQAPGRCQPHAAARRHGLRCAIRPQSAGRRGCMSRVHELVEWVADPFALLVRAGAYALQPMPRMWRLVFPRAWCMGAVPCQHPV